LCFLLAVWSLVEVAELDEEGVVAVWAVVVSLVLGVVDEDEAEEPGVAAALPVMSGLVLVVPFEDELVEPIELVLLLEGLLPAVVVSLCGVVLGLPVAELPVEVP
jgi:hypothetical protein